MKKFLTMFAFAAAIVFGAFTLASCGSDEEVKQYDPTTEPTTEETYLFTPEIKFNTENEATKEADEYQALLLLEIFVKYAGGTMTEADGLKTWDKMLSVFHEKIETPMAQAVKNTNDYTISCTLSLLKDGKVFKTEKFIATPPEK